MSPDEARFHKSVQQLATARAALAAWHEQLPGFAQAHAREVLPVLQQWHAARRAWAFALAAQARDGGFTTSETKALRRLVREVALDVIDHAPLPAATADAEADAEAEALFDSHGDFSHAALRAARAQAQHAEQGPTAAPREAAAADLPDKKPRPKGAAQQRREAEAQQATRSVREVFRQLASALHPDRETDPAQRDVKNVLMQRANRAHADGDLPALLALQAETGPVDAARMAALGSQRLKVYNQALREQLEALALEAERCRAEWCWQFGWRFGWQCGLGSIGLHDDSELTPAHWPRLLAGLRQAAAHGLAQQQREAALLANRAAFRRWLKREQRRLREQPVERF